MEAMANGPVRIINFLVVMALSISLPPRATRGSLNGDDTVMDPLDGGHDNHLSRVLGTVDGGG